MTVPHDDPHGDPEWMHRQLTRLAHHPAVCLCDLSGEFHDITERGCEVCEKAAALHPAPPSVPRVKRDPSELTHGRASDS